MKLAVLDPAHFHAALLQKTMYPKLGNVVHVYAPEGPDLDDYLRKIEAYNARKESPTNWRIRTHTGSDYLEQFIADKAGDIAVIAGNNRRKTQYLSCAIAAGFNVLADKPMAIDRAGFQALANAFAAASERSVLLYDTMTERHEITTMLEKELAATSAVFGKLLQGTSGEPAVVKDSVHHFYKMVSGTPVKRSAWYFDVAEQGEGLVDVATHLVDLVQWECFPDEILDYRTDIRISSARRWPTELSPAQFEKVTQVTRYPDYLRKNAQGDGSLHVYANGEINYVIKGVHAKVSVRWNFEAPAGAGDTHFSVMRGSRSNLVIRQGEAEGHQPVLYIEPAASTDLAAFQTALGGSLEQLQAKYPGVDATRSGRIWQVNVPDSYHVGHEAHFGQVTELFLGYLDRGALPAWEVPNMLAKYYTTTEALAMATG